MNNRIVLFSLIMLLTGEAVGQFKSQIPTQPTDIRSGITTASGSFFGLFSPDRFSMNHSYSFMVYSGGGYSGSIGLLNNTMNFKLADPLFLKVNLGLMHQPFGGPKDAPYQNAHFMHGAELIYKPNNKFQMNIGYSVSPWMPAIQGGGWYNSPFQQSGGGAFEDYRFGGKP